MAATLTTKFWDGDSWNDPAKIVFTSPNMDSPNTAGTRSHVLPDLMDIALWYEDTSNMYRITNNQDAPDDIQFRLYGTTYSGFQCANINALRLNNQTGATGDWPSTGTVYVNDGDYFAYTAKTWNANYIDFPSGNGTGTEAVVSGTKFFLDPSLAEVNFENSIVYEMTLGEAYNCYLTAWDDDTHSSTDNTVISGSHYRVAACACYITGSKDDPKPAELTTYDTLIGTPVLDQVLNGDTNKWTISDPLRYNAIDSSVTGALVFFRPRLYNITSAIPYGVYDFITTFHFQYT
jgi:hypothetical protein